MVYPTPTALGLCITFPILAILSTVARLAAQRIRKSKLALGDWVVIAATILSVANAANVLAGAIVAGIGQHLSTDPESLAELPTRIVNLAIVNYVAQVVVAIAIGMARWSILLLYANIFSVKQFQLPVRIMYALNGAWVVAFSLVYAMQCIPIQQLWTTPQGSRTHCVDVSVNEYFAISSVILDVLVLAMPWPMIWKLQMPWGKKACVLGVLMLGAIIVAVSIGKTYAFFAVEQISNIESDVFYNVGPLFYWTVPECCLSVVCANLPTLAPLFKGQSSKSIMTSLCRIFRIRRRSFGQQSEKSNEFVMIGRNTPSPVRNAENTSIEDKIPLRPTDIQVKTLFTVESRPIT